MVKEKVEDKVKEGGNFTFQRLDIEIVEAMLCDLDYNNKKTGASPTLSYAQSEDDEYRSAKWMGAVDAKNNPVRPQSGHRMRWEVKPLTESARLKLEFDNSDEICIKSVKTKSPDVVHASGAPVAGVVRRVWTEVPFWLDKQRPATGADEEGDLNLEEKSDDRASEESDYSEDYRDSEGNPSTDQSTTPGRLKCFKKTREFNGRGKVFGIAVGTLERTLGVTTCGGTEDATSADVKLNVTVTPKNDGVSVRGEIPHIPPGKTRRGGTTSTQSDASVFLYYDSVAEYGSIAEEDVDSVGVMLTGGEKLCLSRIAYEGVLLFSHVKGLWLKKNSARSWHRTWPISITRLEVKPCRAPPRSENAALTPVTVRGLYKDEAEASRELLPGQDPEDQESMWDNVKGKGGEEAIDSMWDNGKGGDGEGVVVTFTAVSVYGVTIELGDEAKDGICVSEVVINKKVLNDEKFFLEPDQKSCAAHGSNVKCYEQKTTTFNIPEDKEKVKESDD
eukprot:g10509.t1